jgi:hypothetical protein
MMCLRARLVSGSALVVCALAIATVASAGPSYSDPAGDNGVGIDIASVAVSEMDKSVVATVTLASASTLTPGSRIDLWFDLDSDLRTGDEGDEALARYAANGTVTFHRWNGSELVRRPAVAVTATFAAGTLTYTVPKAALENDTSFGVLVVTWGYGETDAGDEVFARDAVPERGRIPYTSPGPATLVDPMRDVPSAPDVTRVGVRDTKDGMIRFTVSTPSHPTVPADATVDLLLDRDLLGEPDAEERSDVQLIYGAGSLDFWRWVPAVEDWIREKSPEASVRRVGKGILVFEVHRSELDDVARFGFNVRSSVLDEEDEYAAYDLAPDRSSWRYTLAYRPPLRLVVGAVRGSPARPLAGHRFTVRVPVRRSDTSRGLSSGTVRCTFRVGGRTMEVSGRIEKGVASCALRVPRNAVVVRGSMDVRALGKSVTVWFAGAIGFGGGTD